jgi:hypothetical protein
MAARMVTLVRYKNHLDEDIRLRWLNVFSLVLFAVMYVAISATPSSPDRTFEGVFATLRNIQIFAIGIWTYGAVILDLSEIFL